MNAKGMGAVLGVAALLAAGAAIAATANDSLVITYRSGKMQTVPLEEPQENVQNIGFISEVAPGPEVKGPTPFRKGESAVPAAERTSPAAPAKRGVTLKWAAPIGE